MKKHIIISGPRKSGKSHLTEAFHMLRNDPFTISAEKLIGPVNETTVKFVNELSEPNHLIIVKDIKDKENLERVINIVNNLLNSETIIHGSSIMFVFVTTEMVSWTDFRDCHIINCHLKSE